MWHYFSLPSCTSVFSLFDWQAPSSQSSLSTRKSNLYLLPSYWFSSFLLHQSSLSGNITQQFLAYDSLFWNSIRILEMKSDQQVSWCPRSFYFVSCCCHHTSLDHCSHILSHQISLFSLLWGLSVPFLTYHVLFNGASV